VGDHAVIRRALYLTIPGQRATPVLDVLVRRCEEVVVALLPNRTFPRRIKNYLRPWWKLPVRVGFELAMKFSHSKPWPWPPLLQRCREYGISPAIVPGRGRLDEPEYESFYHQMDLVVTNGYPKILGERLIAHFDRRVVNFHSSLLPRYRGLNQPLRILANLEPKSGVTLHYVARGADTGELIGQYSFPLDERANLQFHAEQVALGAGLLMEQCWNQIEERVPGRPQPSTAEEPIEIDVVDYVLRRTWNRLRRSVGLAPQRI